MIHLLILVIIHVLMDSFILNFYNFFFKDMKLQLNAKNAMIRVPLATMRQPAKLVLKDL